MNDNNDISIEEIASKLEAFPNDIELWRLLASRLDNNDKKKYCYQRILSIDPANVFANKALQNLSSPPPNNISYFVCPLCGYPNNLTDIQCKRCHTSLNKEAHIRTIFHPVEITSISDLTIPSLSIDPPPGESKEMEDILSMARQYQQKGDNYTARNVLRKLLSEDNHNEQAWLLFSQVAEKPEHEILCLNNVLKINPKNAQAKRRLSEINKSDSDTALPALHLPVISKIDKPSISASGEEVNIPPTPKIVNASQPVIDPYSLHDKRSTLVVFEAQKRGFRNSYIFILCLVGLPFCCLLNSLNEGVPSLASTLIKYVFLIFLFILVLGFFIGMLYWENKIRPLNKEINALESQQRIYPEYFAEEPKISTLTTWKVCQKEVAKTAPACPYCGVGLPGLKVTCPKCGSMNISIIERGFSATKAVAGAALLGPLGVLGGLQGSKNFEYYCLSCQKRWGP
jgi:tetratricopeptide (TPR) repeat protein